MRATFIAFLIASVSWGTTYTTQFSLTENPISEGGRWVNGTVASHWTNMRTTPGFVIGTESSGSSVDDDSTAVVQGLSWGNNQTAMAVVHMVGSPAAEIELRLRTTINGSPTNTITGYEFNFSPGYTQIISWLGGLNSYSILITNSSITLHDGDVVKAVVNGSTLTAYINGVQVNQVTDTQWATGSPGVGFFNAGGGDPTQTDLSFTSFYATDGSAGSLWDGTLNSTRAIDWTTAGIPGGIPARATQCVTAACNTVITNGSSSTAAQINSAIASASANTYVGLSAGTYNLTAGITFAGHNNVTLRGAGANQTILVFTGAGAGSYNSLVALETSAFVENDVPRNVCDFTAGYLPGSTTINLANCGSTTPATGAIGNLKVGGILILDQLDEGADNGAIWNCLAGVSEGGVQCANNPTGSAGYARSNGTCNSGPTMCYRSQQQMVIVASCDGNATAGHTCTSGTGVTITPGIYMPNWRPGQKPQAWYGTTSTMGVGMGLENLTINNCSSMNGTTCNTSSGSGQNININFCDQCYVKGVRSIFANRSHVRTIYSTRAQLQDNYTYENISHDTVSYGIEIVGSSNLVLNNILQQNTDSEPSCSGSCEGNVIAYNFAIDDVYGTAGWMQASNYEHSSGSAFNLWEGNIGPGFNADDVHGTHQFDTVFRNRLVGNQAAGCGGPGVNTCTAQTTPVIIQAGSRYFNVVGNVLGQSGYHNNYWCNATSTGSCGAVQTTIYSTGYTGNGGQQQSAVNGFCTTASCGATGAYDRQVGDYLMRWGNWDIASNSIRWCGNSGNTGWSTTCSSTTEIPGSLPQFFTSVPSSQTLAASYYYPESPSWWPATKAWPPIGPDVNGGNVSNVGGHAYTIPAQDCYLNTMGGPPDGTGGVLAFDATACYGASASGPSGIAGGKISFGGKVVVH